jgi:predicted peptidase
MCNFVFLHAIGAFGCTTVVGLFRLKLQKGRCSTKPPRQRKSLIVQGDFDKIIDTCRSELYSFERRFKMANFRIKWNFNIKASRRSEHRWFALAILLLTVTAIGSAQEETSQDWVKLYEPHMHKEMPYRLMKPMNFDAGKRYPVIVSLHGGAGRGTDNRKQLRPWTEALADEQRRKDYPSYILAPQSQDSWNSTHLEKIKDIIKDLPSVDMNRIYVLGHSMGGRGTYTFIQADPGYFAAAAPSSGSNLPRGEDLLDASMIFDVSAVKDIPIWAFHGDKDNVVSIESDQKLFAEMQKIGGNMKFTTWMGDGHSISAKFITGGDNGSTQLSSDSCDPEPLFLKWLFAQKRSDNNQNRDWVELYEPHVHKERSYRLMKPINFDAGNRYPVIVSLHGGGGKGTDNRKQLKGWNKLLAEEQTRTDYPSYVLAPQANSLWDAEHLQNIKDIIKELPSVDMNRIYILGHSMGGHGTNILIQIDPDYFAAAAPSAGTGLRETEDFIDASVIKDIPIWAFHGDKDKVCPYERDQQLFAEMQKLGGIMKLTTWAGDGHGGVSDKMITGSDNGTTQFSSDRCDPEPVFLKWLFAQKR